MSKTKQTSNPLRITRREFIRAAGATLLAVAAPSSVWAVVSGDEERRLSFFHIHTGETLDAAFRVGKSYRADGLALIDHLLRDHRTGTVHAIDPGLLDILFGLYKGVGGSGPYHVICGYRTAESNAYLAVRYSGIGPKSLHMEGKAIDVRLPGVPLARLRDAALALRAGGVGYYPRSDFVHIDTGRIRHW